MGIGGCQEDIGNSWRIGRLKHTLHEIGDHDRQLHATEFMIKCRSGQTCLNKGLQTGLE